LGVGWCRGCVVDLVFAIFQGEIKRPECLVKNEKYLHCRFGINPTPQYICGMETLALIKRRGDYVHKFVKRNEDVAIYETLLDDEIIGYEVFLIRKQKAKTVYMAGTPVHLKEKELFPTDEMFGSWGYAPATLEKAEYYFQLLTAKIKAKRLGISLN
jgi:hypothetical protein